MKIDDDAAAAGGAGSVASADRGPALSKLLAPWNATVIWLSGRGVAFWAVVLLGLGCLVYLPRLGAYPLWDPWEPHYTQVAWEMQQRLTWNDPWYRGLDNWWSKPILMLWMLRASLATFWDAAKDFANNEWAARLPFALFAIAGGLLHFDWVRRLYGLRTGVLAGLMLMTAPQYLLVGRQVMADTPFVVTYAASIGYLAVGLFTTRRALAPPGSRLPVRVRTWVARNWPFILFWVMQALSVLAKGFVAPALAVMILAGYWAATFRWRDFGELVAGRRWPRYVLVRGAAVAAATAALVVLLGLVHPRPPEERELFRSLLGGFGGLAILFGALHDLPPIRHALRLLARMRASWGLALFLAVAAPWFVYMSIVHGWPYWKEFIFYHHLGRAAGTIDKPNDTFDFFVRQLGFGAFPWTAFIAGAGWSFLGRSSPLRSIAQRRNLFVLLATALPFLFFALAATKFAHYIMPVVPFLTVMLAATLVWLGRDGEKVALAEDGPPLGPAVEAYAAEERQPWWRRHGARGDLLVFAAMALVIFGVLAHDLVDFRYFLRLFVYYYNRATPPGYQPFILLQAIFFPIGVIIGTLLLSRTVRSAHLTLLSAGAVVLACYLSWFMMPAMQSTYSFKPFYEAYERMAKPNEPIGQYNDWQQPVRSVIFLFQNRAVHLRTDKQAATFLTRPGRKFVLVDRNRLADLRRVARSVGVTLYVVFDGHPYGRMVSDQPNAEDTREAARHILEALPPGAERADAEFGDSIRLLGWSAPRVVHRGESVEISLYYRCERVMDRDWQIFVHGDGPQGGSHRIHRDHFPVEGGLYPTTEWQKGEIIRDTFTLTVPRPYPFGTFYIWTGFYIGEERMKLRAGARNDGQDRFRGPMLRVVD